MLMREARFSLSGGIELSSLSWDDTNQTIHEDYKDEKIMCGCNSIKNNKAFYFLESAKRSG